MQQKPSVIKGSGQKAGDFMDETFNHITLVRDILLDYDGYQGDAKALQELIDEATEALTKILDGEKPFNMIAG